MIGLAFIVVAGAFLLIYSGITGVDPRDELAAAFRGEHAKPTGGSSGDIAATNPAGTNGSYSLGQGPGGTGTHSHNKAPNNWESDNARDVLCAYGTPLHCPFNGIIPPTLGFGLLSDDGGTFNGYRMHVRERNTGTTIYLAHLSRIAFGIVPGSVVQKGTILGYSGIANGVNHLHLGVEYGKNPDVYIPAIFGG